MEFIENILSYLDNLKEEDAIMTAEEAAERVRKRRTLEKIEFAEIGVEGVFKLENNGIFTFSNIFDQKIVGRIVGNSAIYVVYDCNKAVLKGRNFLDKDIEIEADGIRTIRAMKKTTSIGKSVELWADFLTKCIENSMDIHSVRKMNEQEGVLKGRINHMKVTPAIDKKRTASSEFSTLSREEALKTIRESELSADDIMAIFALTDRGGLSRKDALEIIKIIASSTGNDNSAADIVPAIDFSDLPRGTALAIIKEIVQSEREKYVSKILNDYNLSSDDKSVRVFDDGFFNANLKEAQGTGYEEVDLIGQFIGQSTNSVIYTNRHHIYDYRTSYDTVCNDTSLVAKKFGGYNIVIKTTDFDYSDGEQETIQKYIKFLSDCIENGLTDEESARTLNEQNEIGIEGISSVEFKPVTLGRNREFTKK